MSQQVEPTSGCGMPPIKCLLLLLATSSIVGQHCQALPRGFRLLSELMARPDDYRTINGELERRLADDDRPEAILAKLKELLDEKMNKTEGGAGAMAVTKLKQLVALEKVNDPNQMCQMYSLRLLKETAGDLIGRIPLTRAPSKIEILLLDTLEKHSERCPPILDAQFSGLNPDVRSELEAIETELRVALEGLASEALEAGPNCNQLRSQRATLIIFKSLDKIAEQHSDSSRYFLHHSADYGIAYVYSIRGLFERRFVRPCKRYMTPLNSIFRPYELAFRFSRALSRSDATSRATQLSSAFQSSFANFQVCRALVENQNSLCKDLIRLVRRRFQN